MKGAGGYMNTESEKNLVPSEKNLINGKREVPLGTSLSKKIDDLFDKFYYGGEIEDNDSYLELLDIVRDMFTLMKHHRYGVLFNVLKKFI